jgi:hypothetical protein
LHVIATRDAQKLTNRFADVLASHTQDIAAPARGAN